MAGTAANNDNTWKDSGWPGAEIIIASQVLPALNSI